MFNFLRNKNRVVGLSIHRGEVRWVEVEKADGHHMVLSHGSLDTGHPVWRYEKSVPKDLVRELAPLGAYKKLPVVCVVPEEYVYHAHLSVPYTSHKDLVDAVENYIESYCLEHDELVAASTVSQYTITSKTRTRAEVSVALYSEEVLEPVEYVLRSLGFRNITMVPYSHTMSALVSAAENRVLLDIGNDISSVLGYTADRITHRTALSVGRQHILELIQDHVGPDLAERVYERYGVKTSHRDPALLSKLHHHVENLVHHAREVITGHAEPANTPVLVTGDEAHIPGLMLFLNNSLGQRVEYLDVWSRFTNPEDALPIIDAHDRFRFAPALGATLDYFDKKKK